MALAHVMYGHGCGVLCLTALPGQELHRLKYASLCKEPHTRLPYGHLPCLRHHVSQHPYVCLHALP